MIDVWIDGSARPNPGIGGIGVVIKGEEVDVTFCKKLPGIVSSNQAEFYALNYALADLLNNQLSSKPITIHSDSQLLIGLITGQRKVSAGGAYIREYKRSLSLISKFNNLSFKQIPREENKHADSLASLAHL